MIKQTVVHNLEYGRRLIDAGITGVIQSTPTATKGRAISSVAAESAVRSIDFVVAGTSLAVLGSFLAGRKRLSRNLLCGAVGGTIGLVAGFLWHTRSITSVVADSAMKEMRKVSDQHWLESHPIDYA